MLEDNTAPSACLEGGGLVESLGRGLSGGLG